MSIAIEQSLTDLLGSTRARIVEALRGRVATVAELARELDLSEVALRRHLHVLERDGLVETETARRDGPGRPSVRYSLSGRGRRLFPDRSAELANDLLDFLREQHGRKALLSFLRWRQARQGERYAAAADTETGDDALAERARQLAGMLTEDGFPSTVAETRDADGEPFVELRQEHCAIADVAEEHPELCAYEAAMFRRVLGAEVSRRQTIAGGAPSCVCTIGPSRSGC